MIGLWLGLGLGSSWVLDLVGLVGLKKFLSQVAWFWEEGKVDMQRELDCTVHLEFVLL